VQRSSSDQVRSLGTTTKACARHRLTPPLSHQLRQPTVNPALRRVKRPASPPPARGPSLRGRRTRPTGCRSSQRSSVGGGGYPAGSRARVHRSAHRMVAGEADAQADALVTDFICHVLESWLLAQHTLTGQSVAACRCASTRKIPPPSESDPGRRRMGEGARRFTRSAASADRGPVGNRSNSRSGMRAARHASHARLIR
jgi:hypothetical protein